MRVVVEPPSGWSVERVGAETRASSAGGRLALDASGLQLLPEDRSGWVERVLRTGLGPDEILTIAHLELAETTLGWPALLVDATIAAGDRPAAGVLAAFYTFLEHGGHAIARAAAVSELDAVRSELRAVLLGARPDFVGPLTSLADFWRDDGWDEVIPPTER